MFVIMSDVIIEDVSQMLLSQIGLINEKKSNEFRINDKLSNFD
jgi:hypothetical protein